MMRLALAAALMLSVVAPAQKLKKDDVLVSFGGALRTVTAREIVIAPEEGNDIRFLRTRRTRFLDKDGKETREIEFRLGDPVTVDAVQRLNTDLEAVDVRHAAPDPAR